MSGTEQREEVWGLGFGVEAEVPGSMPGTEQIEEGNARKHESAGLKQGGLASD